jgi:hypothetical protein
MINPNVYAILRVICISCFLICGIGLAKLEYRINYNLKQQGKLPEPNERFWHSIFIIAIILSVMFFIGSYYAEN